MLFLFSLCHKILQTDLFFHTPIVLYKIENFPFNFSISLRLGKNFNSNFAHMKQLRTKVCNIFQVRK